MTVKVVRTTLNLPVKELDALRAIADRRGVSVTQAFRQAIASERFLDEHRRAGAKVLVKRDGETREVEFHDG